MEFQESDFIGKWIGLSAHKMSLVMTKMLHAHGIALTHEQMILLKIISCSEGISQKDLAIRLNRDKTSIARSVNNLEKNHKVVRINVAGDKRVNNLYLTKEGHQLLEEVHPLFTELTDQLMSEFSEEEIAQLKASLHKLTCKLMKLETQLHTQQ